MPVSVVLAALIVSTAVVCTCEAQQPPTPVPPPPAEQPKVEDEAEKQPPEEQTPPADEPQQDEPKPGDEAAMPGSRRPYRGLFGGGQPYSSRGQSLDLTLSAFGGWDEPLDTTELAPDPLASERVDVEGPFAGSAATVVYTRPGRRLNLSGYGSGFVGYFPDSEDPWYPSSSAGFLGEVNFRLARRTRMSLSLVESYSTDQQLQLSGTGGLGPSDIPAAGGSTGFDNSLRRAPSVNTSPSVTLFHDFSRRSTLQGFYRYRNVYYLDSADDPEDYPTRHDHEVGFRFDRRVSRFLNLRAGYAYRRSFEPDTTGVQVGFHDIDVGVDYARSFSVSRRTTFAFNTGSTVAVSNSGTVEEGAFTDPRFFVIGGAILSHEIGRSWRTFVSYTRDVGFEDGFSEPILRDGANGGVNGLIGRRTDVSASVQFTSSAIGLETKNFLSWTASTQVRTAITRSLAVYAHYYYYLQNFDEGVAPPPGVVEYASRHGVRVGLTSWFPLWSGGI
jgi:opacity protein-like surface antigen